MLIHKPHVNVVRFFEHYEDSITDLLQQRNYLVMEWSPIGSLRHLVHQYNVNNQLVWLPLQEVYCRHFIRGIAEGIGHLHGLGVAHGDLKMGNVILVWKEFQPGEVRDYTANRFLLMTPKLIDFNNSKVGQPGGMYWSGVGNRNFKVG